MFEALMKNGFKSSISSGAAVTEMSPLLTDGRKRYVVLFPYTFVARDWERYGCNDLVKRGYDVWIVQCGALLGIDTKHFSKNDVLSVENIYAPETWEALGLILDQLSKVDIIFVLIDMERGLNAYKELGARNLCYVWHTFGGFPHSSLHHLKSVLSVREYVQFKFESIGGFIYRIKRKLKFFWRVSFSYWKLPAPTLWLKAGSFCPSFFDGAPHLQRSKIVSIQSPVHFEALNNDFDCEAVHTAPYAVFLDQALHDHPDFNIIANESPVTPENYFSGLRNFFKKIEEDLGIAVVIAEHPRYKYTDEQKRTFFGGRRVVSARTLEYVKNADLVIAHTSSSISYAVIFRKPIFILTNDTLEKSNYWNYLVSVSSYLGVRRVNVDRGNMFLGNQKLELPIVNKALYASYERIFLCAEDAEIGGAWDILVDHFESGICNATPN